MYLLILEVYCYLLSDLEDMEEGPEDDATVESLERKSVPLGWRREVKKRRSGKSAGKFDIYYYK